jgi:hypothetical protein
MQPDAISIGVLMLPKGVPHGRVIRKKGYNREYIERLKQ